MKRSQAIAKWNLAVKLGYLYLNRQRDIINLRRKIEEGPNENQADIDKLEEYKVELSQLENEIFSLESEFMGIRLKKDEIDKKSLPQIVAVILILKNHESKRKESTIEDKLFANVNTFNELLKQSKSKTLRLLFNDIDFKAAKYFSISDKKNIEDLKKAIEITM